METKDYLEAAYQREKELQTKMLEERSTFHNIISDLHDKKVYLEVKVNSMEKEISLLRRLLRAIRSGDRDLEDMIEKEMEQEYISWR